MSAFRSEKGSRKPYARPAATRGDAEGHWLHDKAPTAPRADTNGRARVNLTASGPATPSSKLVVSNLHYEITTKDLIAIFGQIGTLVREPLIRYDRSGRSSGIAIISYETSAEATKAKKQFDGILAKGQPMTIVFDTLAPRNPRVRSASGPPTTSSLLNRIQKPPLLDRLSRDDSSIKTPSGPRGRGSSTTGPIRTRQRPAANTNGAGAKPTRGPKKPQTAEELDKELDAFMGDSETAEPVAAPAPQREQEGDVEMA